MSELFNKAKDLAGEHSEQVSQGIDQAKDFVNEKTGGKYEDQINQGTDFVEGHLGLGGHDQPPADPAQPGQEPPAAAPQGEAPAPQ